MTSLTEQILKAFDLSYAESARLEPLILALASAVEALEHFKAIGDMGPEDTVMTFVEDPSNIEYADEALTTLRQVLEGVGK